MITSDASVNGRFSAHLLETLGLLNNAGRLTGFGARKMRQVRAILPELLAPFADGTLPDRFLDCGCGKSYLSFFLNERLAEMGRREARILGVDDEPRLIAACERMRDRLGWRNMQFVCRPISDVSLPEGVDVACSLHACDTATDEALAKGVEVGARRIVAAPCCHRELQRVLKRRHVPPPLGKLLTTFPALSDRFSAAITEGVRALALRACGYSVRVFEFCPGTVTPKNLLLVGEKVRRKSHSAGELVNDMVRFLGHRPAVVKMLGL